MYLILTTLIFAKGFGLSLNYRKPHVSSARTQRESVASAPTLCSHTIWKYGFVLVNCHWNISKSKSCDWKIYSSSSNRPSNILDVDRLGRRHSGTKCLQWQTSRESFNYEPQKLIDRMGLNQMLLLLSWSLYIRVNLPCWNLMGIYAIMPELSVLDV